MNHPHIMVATDLLPKSRPALERGAILARALGANVTLVHVVPVEPWEEQAAERSRDALEQMTQLAQDPIWTGVVQLDTLVSSGSARTPTTSPCIAKLGLPLEASTITSPLACPP